ncbi:MAG: phosphopantetheine-binding protein [Paludibacteraceae bacterium]|nr:phosphopantetheine-binding protein [Paludibacteraceae bacterium]
MDAFGLTRDLLRTALQLGDRAAKLTRDTPLMGGFPEFNSLTVVGIVAGIEEQVGCEISDTEISEDIFQTVGSLADFIEKKLA